MNTFARLLQPPAFADEEKTRRAYILHVLLLYMQLSFVIGGGIGVVFVFSQKTVPTIALLLGVIVMAVAFWLNQRGQVKAASTILISILWFIVTGCILVSHGTRSPVMIFYASGTVTTGLLLGAWGAYIYTIVTILTGLVIASLSSAGIIVIPDLFGIAPFSGWLMLVINLVLTVIPLNIALNTLSAALAKVRAELLERKLVDARLQSRDNVLKTVTIVAQQFLKSSDWRQDINRVLKQLGETIHVSHAYVFEHHPGPEGNEVSSLRYEWVAAGQTADLPNPLFQNSPIRSEGFKRSYEMLSQGLVLVGDKKTLSATEADILHRRGIQALLEMPIVVNGRWWGTIGFDECAQEREWRTEEIEALMVTANLLSVVIQRQEADFNLRLSEERYRLVNATISDYTFSAVRDADGKLHQNWVAGAFEKITGYTMEEFTQQGGWLTILHPEDRERDARDIQQLMQKHRVMSEVRIIRKDGAIRWVQVYAHPLWNEATDELVGIYGAVQDVTERKQIEETLERERTLLRTVINNLPDYIYLKDTEHRCLVSNLANAQTLGVSSPEEVEGKTLFDFYPPEEAERFNALDKKIITTGEAILRQEGHFIDTQTGQKRWTWMTRTPLRAKNGRIMGVVGISRDITAYKEAEMEREQLINDLKAKNRELEQFTYTVSHDLKSPLVTVTGFLGYLEKDMVTGNTERMKKDIGLIQEAVKKMKRLLDDLLELSRVGRVMNPPVQIPFNSIVQEALTLVEGRISDRRVQIEVAENLPIVYGDRGRLVELVQNLVDNAVKFMGDQPQPHIEIGSQGQSEQGNPIFFIKDNGIGIAPPYHDNIFGLFNKLNPQVDGTGIGLALVKQIIEVHNGRIWIESEGKNTGSTFYFYLGHLPEQPPKL